MLIISRAEGGKIMIGEDIVITLVEVNWRRCRIGIDAPRNVAIWREEIFEAIQAGEPDTRKVKE